MQFSLSFLTSFKSRITFSLRSLLSVSWWILLGLILAILFLDGLLFYLYGLGYVESSAALSPSPGAIRLEQDAIRRAASLIQDSQTRFAGPPALPADFPDPFK